MVQLRILSGKKAGSAYVARRFPVHSFPTRRTADLRLEEDGVWDQHLQLDLNPADGFHLRAQLGALVTLNGSPLPTTPLRNGDTIGIGALKIQFWLSETRQRGLGLREWLTWAAIAALALGQVAVIYLLLR